MCDDRVIELVDLAEGTLDEARRPALEAHLSGCASCRAELETLRTMGGALTGTRDEPHDLMLSGFPARTTDRAEKFRDRSARGLLWSTTRAMRWGLGLSAASLVLAVFIAMPRQHGNQHPRPAPVATAPTAATTGYADTWYGSEDAAVESDGTLVTYDSAFDALSDDELDALDQLLDQNPT